MLRRTLVGAAILLVSREAHAAQCGAIPYSESSVVPLTSGETPSNAHVFVLVRGDAPVVLRLSRTESPLKPLLTRPVVHPLKVDRVLELVPEEPLAPNSDYGIYETAGGPPSRLFHTLDRADLEAPLTTFDSAAVASGGTVDRCDPRTPIELATAGATTLDAAYVYLWLPDEADELDLNGPPDVFDSMRDRLLFLPAALDDVPTKIGVQLVDGAGNVSGRREVSLGQALTFGKRLRVFRARLAKSMGRHGVAWSLGGLALVLAVVGSAWALRRRRSLNSR